mgnify:CR=1 FL=1
MKEKKEESKLQAILSWVLLIVMAGLLVFTIFRVAESKKTGEGVFLLGYRPVLVLTGSMEPYMMTNGIALTKEVDSLDDIAVGDVVTYHVMNDDGKKLLITHRIVAIDDGLIYTKGDNNNVIDGYPLTMDNVEAKVVGVFNGTAWLAAKWATTAGKIMLICFLAAIILLCYTVKAIRASKKEETPADASFAEAADTPSVEADTSPEHEEKENE